MKVKGFIRVAVYLLVYLGVPVAASELANQTAGSVLGIIYLLLLVPVGIVRMIEFYRTNDGSTLARRIFNAVFRVPLALFGLVCLLTGTAMIGWVLYNIFVHRLKQYTGPPLVIGWGSFGVGVPLVLYGWFTLRSVVRRKDDPTTDEKEKFEHEDDDEEPAAELGRE